MQYLFFHFQWCLLQHHGGVAQSRQFSPDTHRMRSPNPQCQKGNKIIFIGDYIMRITFMICLSLHIPPMQCIVYLAVVFAAPYTASFGWHYFFFFVFFLCLYLICFCYCYSSSALYWLLHSLFVLLLHHDHCIISSPLPNWMCDICTDWLNLEHTLSKPHSNSFMQQ